MEDSPSSESLSTTTTYANYAAPLSYWYWEQAHAHGVCKSSGKNNTVAITWGNFGGVVGEGYV